MTIAYRSVASIRIGASARSALAIAGPLAVGLWTGDLVSAVLVSVGGIAAMLADRDGPLRERAAVVVPAAVAAASGMAAGMAGATFGWSGRMGILVTAAGLSALLTVRRPGWSIVALNLLVFTSLGTGAAELTSAPPWYAAVCLALGGCLILAVPDVGTAAPHQVRVTRPVSARFPLGLVLCIAAAGALGEPLHLEQAYWVPLTVAFIYKPDLGPVAGRAVHRMAGTLVGATAGGLLAATIALAGISLARPVTPTPKERP